MKYPDPMVLTLMFIFFSGLIMAILKKYKRDKCLKDFNGYTVTIELKEGDEKSIVFGVLNLYSGALEFIYSELHKDVDGHEEYSYVLYKSEFDSFDLLIRYHKDLTKENKEKRIKELDKTYHPKFLRRIKRDIHNLVKTVKDSVLEVLNVCISQAKTKGPTKTILSGDRGKYVDQMRDHLIGAVGTSYEPLLEKYIGYKVVLEVIREGKVIEYCGVLKDYTAEFIEIMDVDYNPEPEKIEKVDIIVSRKICFVRHSAEKIL